MKINPKSQKGAITLVVLVSMLFLTAFLMSMYIGIANNARTSAETTKQIAEKYNNLEEANAIYDSYFSDSEIIPIYTREHLEKIGSGEQITINGKIYTFTPSAYYTLQNDLDLGGYYDETTKTWTASTEDEWFPLPLTDSTGKQYKFTGILDGLGHSITGMYINTQTGTNQGLFGTLEGTVKNIVIDSGYINSQAGRAYIGVLAGKTVNTAQIINCKNKVTVESTNSVGGFVGENRGLISNCVNEGEIIGIHADVGGISGENYGTVINCKNIGNISSGSGTRGGITGLNGSLVKKCANEGEIRGSGGGVVGHNESNATIELCYNAGSIEYGGICQVNLGIIKNCYNIHENIGTNAWVAGIVGNNDSGKVSNCYNIGKAKNGLVGNNGGSIEYCYYLSGSSSQMHISTATGAVNNCSEKTEEEFFTEEFLALLNTGNDETVWVEDTEKINKGYPILKWQIEEKQ